MSGSWSRRYPRLAAETQAASASDADPEPPDDNPYLAGEVIGDRYRLVRPLGTGGMGVVWVAHSLVLGVDVALKLIRASRASPALGSRMAREAHAAARLGHPALVRVFDFGWTNRGDPFLVMELVQGETLSALLGREPRVPAIRAVQMLLPIADGLRLAHDKKIVHRDIKPDNIFLATDALGRVQPKLLDFGIAKVGPLNVDGRLTQVGTVLGSPEYMSPEQALGQEDVDDRTDVWSLCVVLYEMVTGTVPFRKQNYNALMQSIINDSPKSIPDHAAGDRALWLVVERGLKKDRNQRWADMTELGEALALWLYEHGIKEDVSGNSIRAVWLDGVLSGLRADVPASEVPPIGAGADPSRIRGRDRSAAVTTAPQPRGGARGLFTRLLGTKAKRWGALAALAALVAAAVASWAARGLQSPPEPRDAAPRRPAAAFKSETQSPVTTPRATAQEVPDPPPAPSAPPGKGSAKTTAAPQPRTAPVRRRPPTPPRSGETIRDFGF